MRTAENVFVCHLHGMPLFQSIGRRVPGCGASAMVQHNAIRIDNMKTRIRTFLLYLPVAGSALMVGLEATGAESYRDLVLADGPTACYRLEETEGELTAVDRSTAGAFPGNYIYSSDGLFPKLAQPGIEVNSVYFRSYTDEYGAAQSSYVRVPYAPELNTAGPFTGEAWVRTISVATDGSYRSPLCNFGGWGAGYPGWFFYQSPEGPNPSVWILVMKGGGIWLQSSQPVRRYEREHLVLTFDGSDVRFYVNGAFVWNSTVPDYTPNPGNDSSALARPARGDLTATLTRSPSATVS